MHVRRAPGLRPKRPRLSRAEATATEELEALVHLPLRAQRGGLLRVPLTTTLPPVNHQLGTLVDGHVDHAATGEWNRGRPTLDPLREGSSDVAVVAHLFVSWCERPVAGFDPARSDTQRAFETRIARAIGDADQLVFRHLARTCAKRMADTQGQLDRGQCFDDDSTSTETEGVEVIRCHDAQRATETDLVDCGAAHAHARIDDLPDVPYAACGADNRQDLKLPFGDALFALALGQHRFDRLDLGRGFGMGQEHASQLR